jgi:hypothetical protein
VAIAICPWAAVAGVGLSSIDLVSGDGDAQAARRRLEKELPASSPGAPVRSALLRSPFHGGDGPTAAASGIFESEHNERKEYAVAWSQPAR